MFLYCNFSQRQLACGPSSRHEFHAELGGRLSSKRVDLIVGTRPEAIKLAPVAVALRRRGLKVRLVLTGQHPLNVVEHGLEGFERIALGCQGGGDPHDVVKEVMHSVAHLVKDPPQLAVVQGDTASALGGALAAFASGIPVAHVEAGLRSFDPEMPWPEEEYRTAIDAQADLLFAPTDISAANLYAEDVPGRVYVTGNTGIDALRAVLARQQQPSLVAERPLKLLVTCHRRESWGAGLKSIASALIELASTHALTIDLVLHPNPIVTNAMRELLRGIAGIALLEPLSHSQTIAAMQAADIILSDSGGIQEEAPALGIPLLVLRAKTERPEGVASGNMVLVGTDTRRIVENVERLLDSTVRAAMSRPAFPYGDGYSAERIAGHIADFLASDAPDSGRLHRA